jgi:hypothetical protein
MKRARRPSRSSLTLPPRVSFRHAQGRRLVLVQAGFDPRYARRSARWSVSRYHRANYHYRNPSPLFTLYYLRFR